ncbi:MAG: GNAT family N-acetyltransferase [Gemmataceae bacterium]|nr:GNAT family N-acetyltransferase [Gemmataceae bacterium]
MSVSTGRAQRDRVRLHIRWMIRRDLPDVLLAERASFEFPWTEDDFLRCLRQRNCIGMVAETDDPPGFPPAAHPWAHGGSRAVGFMIYELHKTRLHILNFAVHPYARGAGIGGQMVGKLVHKLTTHRRLKITLAVRERNLAAQTFFRRHDFRATRVLRNYYEDSGEDAFQMEYRAGAEFADEPVGPVNRIAQYEEN